jgi:hypothetical protein
MTATLDIAPAAQRGMGCPRCTAPMRLLKLSTHRQASIAVDHCPDCRLVWFDELESVQLDGLGWVRLLREMEDGGGRPLADAAVARPACPACALPLNTVQNRTRYGLFAALECPQRHGHLHSHSGLLAERGLVRPLGVAERRALAQEKHRLHCFNCGAAAASSDEHCSYCRTALVVLDLPRLAHSLRLRNDAMAPSPAAPGRHAVWSCRGCGAALDPGREISCSHCSHLVVAQELPDILPLLQAAEAEQAAAAAIDAQRRARFPSAQRPPSQDAARPPPRALTQRAPQASAARRLMLAGWLPLVLLGMVALTLAAVALADRHGPPPPPPEVLRRQLFDAYTRQVTGERAPARATVDGPPATPDLGRWNRALARQLRLLPMADDAPLPEEAAPSGSRWRPQAQAPGLWVDEARAQGLWTPWIENTGPGPLSARRLAVKVMVSGPDGVAWRCQPLGKASPVLAPGGRVQLLCRTTVLVRLQEELWLEAARRLGDATPPKLVWQDEDIAQPGGWAQAADLLVAHADAQPRASPPGLLRAVLTRAYWREMSASRQLRLALAALLVAFVGYCAMARWRGERRARWVMLGLAVPLCYLAGRGEGAASVLLVGMYLSLCVIGGLAFGFGYRLYRDLFFRPFD